MDERYIDLVTGYLQGTLSSNENERLNKLIEEGRLDYSEIMEMVKLYREMGSIEEPEPGERVRRRFYNFLETEKEKQSETFYNRVGGWVQRFTYSLNPGKWGYAVALLFIGLLFGRLFTPLSTQDDKIEQLTAEVHRMQELMMISLLENDSPVERLRAVNISSEIQSSDTRTIDALLNTLNNDSNVNVRIAAVNALVAHGSDPEARKGMVQSITRQKSPLVQIALADAMIALQEEESVDRFRELLARDNMDTNVRYKLENTILALL